MNPFDVSVGRAWPLGATVTETGVNFALFSAHATAVDLCLFSEDGKTERQRIRLPDRDGDIWHGHVAGLGVGTVYGYRVHGPYDPDLGHRFNPNKLLLDPYARQICGELHWSDRLMGYRVGDPAADLSFDDRDSAADTVKARIADLHFDWQGDRPPRIPPQDSVIYEAHAKGLTAAHPQIPPELRGTYLGIASEPMVAHLSFLGVTALELLPVQYFLDDRMLVAKGLRNYWGYQTLGFLAPAARYAGGNALDEFRIMVRTLHKAGIEVILDVVYNHSGEGDELGPTLCFRGIDNQSYYRLAPSPRYYVNDTGTGNTLNAAHPMVLRLILDSLRFWVEVMHVDGFRFDLATTVARGPRGFEAAGAFLAAVRQDPVLAPVKLIAEPWDLGPGGYRLGQFPHPFHEWNDRFRDGVRRFWRGDAGMTPDMAKRILGSAELFDRRGRSASTSINFLTSHDGFTLQDLVCYTKKHNEANGEHNRDGHPHNHSDNFGTEGPSQDPAVRTARALRIRNLLATLFLSQGVPMLLAGDEAGNSQQGNNNAYAQDNEIGWIDWGGDPALTLFVRRLSALRRAHPVLRQRRFLHAGERPWDGQSDLEWRMPDGRAPTIRDWDNPEWRTLCVVIRGSAEAVTEESPGEVFAVFNAGNRQTIHLPSGSWVLALDTARPDLPALAVNEPEIVTECDSVLLFVRPAAPAAPTACARLPEKETTP